MNDVVKKWRRKLAAGGDHLCAREAAQKAAQEAASSGEAEECSLAKWEENTVTGWMGYPDTPDTHAIWLFSASISTCALCAAYRCPDCPLSKKDGGCSFAGSAYNDAFWRGDKARMVKVLRKIVKEKETRSGQGASR